MGIALKITFSYHQKSKKWMRVLISFRYGEDFHQGGAHEMLDNRCMENASGDAIEVLIVNLCLGRVQHFSHCLSHFRFTGWFH
jgi:hypothetical protein